MINVSRFTQGCNNPGLKLAYAFGVKVFGASEGDAAQSLHVEDRAEDYDGKPLRAIISMALQKRSSSPIVV